MGTGSKGRLRGVDLGSGIWDPVPKGWQGEGEQAAANTAQHVPAKPPIEANPKGSAK